MTREERRKIATITINTDGMYFMGLDVPYVDNIEVLLNGFPQYTVGSSDKEPELTNVAVNNGISSGVLPTYGSSNDSSNEITSSVVVNNIMNNGMIENPLLFKRWVCAQTFRMLNYKGGKSNGWDAYMKENLTYSYQFNMLYDEIKRLSKMEKEGGHDFEIESMFWTFNTVQQIYRENFYNVIKFFKEQLSNRNYVVVIRLNHGRYRHLSIKNVETINSFINPFTKLVDKMSEVRTYRELLSIMKELNKMPVCPRDHSKCPTWKSVYRGYGGFYTLYNLFGWHGITLNGMDMKESIEYIEDLLSGEFFNDPWKFHYVLKDVIEENNFDLADSIKRTERMRIN